MLLTLVLVFMSSVGWGQECNVITLKRALKKLEGTLEEIRTKCVKSPVPKEDEELCGSQKEKIEKRENAQKELDDCEKKEKEEKEAKKDEKEEKKAEKERTEKICEKTLADIDKGLERFSSKDHEKALKCMEGGLTSEADTTAAVLRAMGGNSTADPNVCAIKASKSPYADVLQKQMTQIEKLEKEVKSINEKIVKQKKDTTDQLADLNEDRIKLKEAWDKRQTEQETEQARALNAMRENQIKVQEAIRKANAELINARQDMAKAERKRSEELLKAGVQSFSSMSRICNAQVKDYYKKAELNKKKKSGSLGSAMGKGSSKKKDLQSFMDDCLKSMEEKRNAIYDDSANYLVQMINNIKDRQESIATLEGEYKNQMDSYKKAIEREANALDKDYKAFFYKDNNLGEKIKQYQLNAQREATQLDIDKRIAVQAQTAAQNTKGEYETEEIKDAIDGLQKHMALVESLAGEGLKDGKLVAGKKLKCPEQFERFKSEVSEYGARRTTIQENKGSQYPPPSPSSSPSELVT